MSSTSSYAIHSSHFPQKVNADTVSNGNYSIDVNTIDTNPQPTPYSHVLGTNTIQQSSFTTGPNYTVNTSQDAFSIRLSQDSIDYGILSSTNPVIRTATITITNPSLGAEVVTDENHPLLFGSKNVIYNTSCDNGACTPDTAAQWTNTLTYGFGYRCDSENAGVCDPQFSEPDYFKQYPNDAGNQNVVTILTSHPKEATTKVTITDKINISGTQKTGAYYNSITYLAVPNF